MRRLTIGLGLASMVTLTGWFLVSRSPPALPSQADGFSLTFTDLQAHGFPPLGNDWVFEFPRDHTAHENFRSEVWNLTAVLRDEQDQLRGVQFSLLRLGLSPEPPQHPSAWAAGQLYRADVVVTDVDRRVSASRSSRGVLDLAGSQQHPPRVWVQDWQLEAHEQGLALQAHSSEIGLSLRFNTLREPLLQPAQGQGETAFHGYSLPRLAVSGELTLEGDTLPVEGSAWLERAWGAIPLPRGQQALDRFLIHLDNAQELAIFRLHRRGGGGTPVPTALWLSPDGTVREYARQDLSLEPTGFWDSPQGERYPVAWQLSLPAERLTLQLEALRQEQAQDFPLRSWVGPITVQGEQQGNTITGVGYQSLTGYSNSSRTATVER